MKQCKWFHEPCGWPEIESICLMPTTVIWQSLDVKIKAMNTAVTDLGPSKQFILDPRT